MKIKERLKSLFGVFWNLAGIGTILLISLSFFFTLILNEGEIYMFPLWIKTVLLIPLLIMGLSSLCLIAILVIQVILGDY